MDSQLLGFSLVLVCGALVMLALIWLGYPIAMRLWAAVGGQTIRPDHHAGAQRAVSIVLATRESVADIEARVANLLDTDHPSDRLQLIVTLDAEGAKATPAALTHLVRSDERITIVSGDAPGGKAAALNAGVRAATGDVLVMADTAQRFDRCTIPELVAHLEDQRFGAVSGALELAGTASSPVAVYWRLERWLRRQEAAVHSAIGVTGAVYAVRRDCWPVLPAGTLLDDVHVPMALVLRGWRVGFVPQARAFDQRVFTASAESNRKARTLTGLFQLHSQLPALLTATNPLVGRYVLHKLSRLTTPVWLLLAALGGLGVLLYAATTAPRTTAFTLALLIGVVALVPPLRQRVAAGWHWMVALQLAVLRALRNGLRKQWQVWSPTNRM